MITLLQAAERLQGPALAVQYYPLPGEAPATNALATVARVNLPAGQTFTQPPPVLDRDILTWIHRGAVRACAAPFPPEDLTENWLHAVGTEPNGASPTWQAMCDSTLIQFHILPETQEAAPEQSVRPAFAALEDGGFRILASGFAEDDPEDNPEATLTITDGAPLTLRSRSRLLHAALPQGEGAAYQTTPERALFLLVVEGQARIDGTTLQPQDAALITGEENLTVIASTQSVLLLVDTPLTPESLL